MTDLIVRRSVADRYHIEREIGVYLAKDIGERRTLFGGDTYLPIQPQPEGKAPAMTADRIPPG